MLKIWKPNPEVSAFHVTIRVAVHTNRASELTIHFDDDDHDRRSPTHWHSFPSVVLSSCCSWVALSHKERFTTVRGCRWQKNVVFEYQYVGIHRNKLWGILIEQWYCDWICLWWQTQVPDRHKCKTQVEDSFGLATKRYLPRKCPRIVDSWKLAFRSMWNGRWHACFLRSSAQVELIIIDQKSQQYHNTESKQASKH